MVDSQEEKPNGHAATQTQDTKIVHVYRNSGQGKKGGKLFEFLGVPITVDLIQMAITGGLTVSVAAMIMNEINRRKMDEQNRDQINALEAQLSQIGQNAPNVEFNGHSESEQQAPQPENNTNSREYSDNGYYDYTNRVEESAVNDTNLNTIRPFMESVSDRGEAMARNHEIYQKQRRYFNYELAGNPNKTQHIVTGQDFDAEMDQTAPSLPSSRNQNAHTSNTVGVPPNSGRGRNMYMGKDGIVRKIAPRQEIQVNLA